MMCILMSFFVYRSSIMPGNGYKKISTDEDDTGNASFFSLLLFQWMNSIFKTGSKRTINQTDFLPLSKENSACFVTGKLQGNWNKEISNCEGNGKKPKLWKSVLKLITVKETVIIVFSNALFSISRILQPLFLGYLVSALMSTEPQNNPVLYGCALALCINALIACFSMHQLDYRCEILGIKISSALKGLIYHKVSANGTIKKAKMQRYCFHGNLLAWQPLVY